MVNSYLLVNPHIEGKFKNKIKAKNSQEAASIFYKNLSEHFNKIISLIISSKILPKIVSLLRYTLIKEVLRYYTFKFNVLESFQIYLLKTVLKFKFIII